MKAAARNRHRPDYEQGPPQRHHQRPQPPRRPRVHRPPSRPSHRREPGDGEGGEGFAESGYRRPKMTGIQSIRIAIEGYGFWWQRLIIDNRSEAGVVCQNGTLMAHWRYPSV